MQLLKLEILIGYTASITFLTLILVVSFVKMDRWLSILWTRHMGRTRKLKCPKRGKKSWHKKVISK